MVLLDTLFSLKMYVPYDKELFRRMLGRKEYEINIAQGKLACV
jgi:hypothetical protein